MLVVTGSLVWPPVPALMVSSVDSSLDYYVRVLGFGLVSKSYRDGELASAHLQWAGYSWLLLVAEQKQLPSGSVKRIGLRYCFWAECDLYALTARTVQQGGQIASGPITHPWGIREVTFSDPDGYLLTFCQRVKLPKLTNWWTSP